MIVLSVAHHPHPGRPGADPGAVGRTPDGAAAEEAALSARITAAAAAGLRDRGLSVLVIDETLARTVSMLRDLPEGSVQLALEIHLNAGNRPGDRDPYGLVIARRDSAAARAAARALASRVAAVRAAPPWRVNPRVETWLCPLPPGLIPARRLAFVEGHPHPAVISEPGFITDPAGLAFLTSPAGVAAVADAHVLAIVEAVSAP